MNESKFQVFTLDWGSLFKTLRLSLRERSKRPTLRVGGDWSSEIAIIRPDFSGIRDYLLIPDYFFADEKTNNMSLIEFSKIKDKKRRELLLVVTYVPTIVFHTITCLTPYAVDNDDDYDDDDDDDDDDDGDDDDDDDGDELNTN
uniref:Uncharacterized protein n=1 Tax=Glossina austeni TaxID=7395 RepID=A0A1A9V7T4_GLOAU